MIDLLNDNFNIKTINAHTISISDYKNHTFNIVLFINFQNNYYK